MFGGSSILLEDIVRIADKMPEPISRKYCLNFAFASDSEVRVEVLDRFFDKEKFMVKITPIHNNNACRQNNIMTTGGYDSWQPYQTLEEELKRAGWDVLVFIPSMDEEMGLVTCGNAILGGSQIAVDSAMSSIQGI